MLNKLTKINFSNFRIKNLNNEVSYTLLCREQFKYLKTKHSYHLVDPSPWPVLAAFGAFMLTLGTVLYMHRFIGGLGLASTGFLAIIYCMYTWWRDVVREATFEDTHSQTVLKGLKLGMILFIASEVMFFFAFFWAFFHSSIAPVFNVGGVWPPKAIVSINTYTIPLTNTFFLLTSGATVTWAHHALIARAKRQTLIALIFTLTLAILFTAFQGFEYVNAPFNISDGVYGSCFYMATGFHGFHVIVGTIALFVSFIRIILNHFTNKHHFGFESAIWYWHFVDVVWLFLFINVYWWGGDSSSLPTGEESLLITTSSVVVYNYKHFFLFTVFLLLMYVSHNYDYDKSNFYKKYIKPIFEKNELLILGFVLSFSYFLGGFYVLMYIFFYISITLIKRLDLLKNFFIIYKKDLTIIKTHYLNEFRYFYYFINGIRILTFFVFFCPMFVSQEIIEYYLPVIGKIYHVFLIVTIIDFLIILFIVYFRNTKTTYSLIHTCVGCASVLGGCHFIAYSPVGDPTDPLIQFYHMHSPFGRGYLVYSREHLLILEHVRGVMGSDFNITACIDKNHYLNVNQMYTHAQSLGYSIPNIQNFYTMSSMGRGIDPRPPVMKPEPLAPGQKFSGIAPGYWTGPRKN